VITQCQKFIFYKSSLTVATAFKNLLIVAAKREELGTMSGTGLLTGRKRPTPSIQRISLIHKAQVTRLHHLLFSSSTSVWRWLNWLRRWAFSVLNWSASALHTETHSQLHIVISNNAATQSSFRLWINTGSPVVGLHHVVNNRSLAVSSRSTLQLAYWSILLCD